ncbi:MAG: PRC-barrel domain-containing protein [Paracoccaceae bacterium]
MAHPTTTTHDTGGAFGFVRDGYNRAETRDLTTNDVESASVYGRGDETIGAISSLKMGTDGKISDAIIDVGGFLGMGAHSVKVPFSQLTVLRETNGSAVRVHMDTTKEKLKAMPHYAG